MAQFNMPCPNPFLCDNAESAVLNLTSEAPDAIRYFGFKFFGDQWGLCITTDPELAALCDLPFPTNPPALILSSSAPQTCTVPCDGIPVSYTAAAGTFVAATQGEADAQAYAFACIVAQIICDGGTVTVFTNTPQTCSCNNGSVSVTIPVGVASGLTQESANSAAFELACVVAGLLCSQEPPPGVFPPVDIPIPPVPLFYFRNTQQSCNFNCPDGQSVFTHVIRGGLFYGTSPAIANAVAQSYACNPSLSTLACLDSIVTDICENSPYADIITVSGFTEVSMSIVAGFLPLGLFFNSNGIISGSPLELGQFPITVRATQGSDYVDRTYTFSVRAITTINLPSGTEGDPFNEVLAQTGFSTAAVWSISSGVLPPGLALQTSTGVISGTLNTEGVYSFTVGITEGSTTCTQDYTITVASPSSLDWSTLAWLPYLGPTFTQVAFAAGSSASGSAAGNSANGQAESATPIAPPSGDYTSYFAAIGTLTYTGPAQNAQSSLTFNVLDAGGGQSANVTIIINVDGNPVMVQAIGGPLNIGIDISPFVVPLSVGALIEVIVIIGSQNAEFLPAPFPHAIGSVVITNTP